MSSRFWKIANQCAGYLPYVGIFSALLISANIEVRDLDLWLHLAMGKYIVQTGSIPGTDMLSAAITGAPWVNHEWLFQILVHGIFASGGAQGLLIMQTVVVSLTMLVLLFLGYGKNRQLFVAVILFFLYMVYCQRFTIRPDLFSLLFFSLYIFILSLHIDKKWSVPALFVIQVIWSNMHGFFFFGPLFVLIGIVSEWIKRHCRLPFEWNDAGRLTDEEYRRIKIILGVTVGACLINPMFVKGAWYPISVFFTFSGKNKVFFQYIQELQSPVTWQTFLDITQYRYYKVLVFLSFISFIFNRRRIDISALIFWLVFLVFSLSAVRNTSFFAFAAYLVIITNTIHLRYEDVVPIRFSDEKFKYLTLMILNLLLFVWMIGYVQSLAGKRYYDFDRHAYKSLYGGVSKVNYPYKAVDFLVDNNVKGNFFNDFNSGAYLLGRAYPNIKTFIDGRTEVYGGAFFNRYLKIWKDGNGAVFEKAAAQYNLTGAFLNGSVLHIPKKILNYFYNNDQWVMVYFDYDAVIFLKDVAQNRDIINRYRINLENWQVQPFDTEDLGPERIRPYPFYYRGYALESLGIYDKAIAELEEAIRVDPVYAKAYGLLGKIYAEQKRYGQAFEHFRIAVMINPKDYEMRKNLALSYSDLGKPKEAIAQYLTMVHQQPRNPKGHYLLAKTYISDGQFAKGVEAVSRAFSLDRESTPDLIKIGDMLLASKAFQEAHAVYQLGIGAGSDQGLLYKKMGLVSLKMDDAQSAQSELQKAQTLMPDDSKITSLLEGL